MICDATRRANLASYHHQAYIVSRHCIIMSATVEQTQEEKKPLELCMNIHGVEGCLPNLVPFHIDHTGSARVSMYMQVEGVERGVGVPEDGSADEGNANSKANTDGQAGGEESKADSCIKRYVSTFRGRSMHGLDVVLPSGYQGLVLRKAKGGEQLTVGGTFDSMRVWHPDMPVDEGRDEYVRCLMEWTRLASEVAV